MKEISLTRGLVALVDDEDYEELSRYKWYASSNGYARRNGWRSGYPRKRALVSMHREIMGLLSGDNREVDHIDGNKLNNQRSNLRICTHAENMRNRKVTSKRISGLKGAHWRPGNGWISLIGHQGKNYALGTFDTPEEANAAYCAAAAVLHGEYANSGDGPIDEDKLRALLQLPLKRRTTGRPRGAASPLAVAVLCVDTNTVFGSTAEAAQWVTETRKSKAYASSITSVCTGRCRRAYGFTWRYAEERKMAA